MDYFISDTHFFHAELLGNNDFAPRPFKTVSAMNAQLISVWNARVAAQDTVYHLGDIAMLPSNHDGMTTVVETLMQLNGRIIFIKGNHDNRALLKFIAKNQVQLANGQEKFGFHDVGALIKADHFQFFMTHYPMIMGISSQVMNLHGHIHHSSMPFQSNINVGVDSPEREFLATKLPFGTPLSIPELIEIYAYKGRLMAELQTQQK